MSDIIENAAAEANRADGPPAPVEDTRTYNEQQAAERDAAEAQRTAALTPGQKELEVIKKSDAYWKGDDPDHQKIMTRIRQLLAAEKQANPEEAQRQADRTVADLRAEFGVEQPKIVMPGLVWNEADEATFYQTAHQQGWDAPLVKSLVADYAEQVQASGGKITDEMVERFHKDYGKRLTKSERDALVNWIRRSRVVSAVIDSFRTPLVIDNTVRAELRDLKGSLAARDAARSEYQPMRSCRPHHALVHVFDGDVQGALRLLRRRLDGGVGGLIMRHESRLYVAMTRSQKRMRKSRVARRRRLKTAKKAAQRDRREAAWGW